MTENSPDYRDIYLKSALLACIWHIVYNRRAWEASKLFSESKTPEMNFYFHIDLWCNVMLRIFIKKNMFCGSFETFLEYQIYAQNSDGIDFWPWNFSNFLEILTIGCVILRVRLFLLLRSSSREIERFNRYLCCTIKDRRTYSLRCRHRNFGSQVISSLAQRE